MEETQGREPKKIEMRPIGFVRRTSQHENDRDRSLVAQVVLDEALAPALDGIEEWSHIYVKGDNMKEKAKGITPPLTMPFSGSGEACEQELRLRNPP